MYEKIICIYTCEKDIVSKNLIKKSKWYKKEIKNKKNKIIFVYAKKIKKNFDLIKDILYVNTEEEYSNLSIKTLKMIKACVKMFNFKYLIKLDSTLINYKTEIKELNFKNFENWYDSKLWLSPYSGIYLHKDVTIDSIKKWCTRKGLSCKPNMIIQCKKISYYSGKCYSINYSNCIHISNKIRESMLYRMHMAGIEDIFISQNIKYINKK